MIALGLVVSFISFRGIVKDKFIARMKRARKKNDGLQKKKKPLIKKIYRRRFCYGFFFFWDLVFLLAE